MDALTRMMVQAAALSVFIAAASWGAVRAGLIGLSATRYFQMRGERHVELADAPRPRVFAHVQLLVAAAVCWPAAVVFLVVWGTGAMPSGVWTAVAVAGPVLAAAGLVVVSRSPWAKLRGVFSLASRVPMDRRDEMLVRGYDADPQLKADGAGS